jgi:predicted nucleic acid-binding protein
MAGLDLTDASPLIGLSIVDGLGWLETLFGHVWMPSEVRREVLSGRVTRGESGIRAAIADGWLCEWPDGAAEAAPLIVLPDLDEGEAACIRIAIAHADDALILMDERAGRAVATEHGLRVTGTAAVIGMAQARGLIPSARSVFDILHQSDFRVSAAVIQTVLRRVGE